MSHIVQILKGKYWITLRVCLRISIQIVYAGSMCKKITEMNHHKLKSHGSFRHWDKVEIENIMRKLLIEECLREEMMTLQKQNITYSVVRLGKKANSILNGNQKFRMIVSSDVRRKPIKESLSVEGDKDFEQIYQDCYSEIIELAKRIASASKDEKVKYWTVLSVQAMRQISRKLPADKEELLRVDGVTDFFVKKHGGECLQLCAKFIERKRDLEFIKLQADSVSESSSSKSSTAKKKKVTHVNLQVLQQPKRTYPFKSKYNNFRRYKNANTTGRDFVMD